MLESEKPLKLPTPLWGADSLRNIPKPNTPVVFSAWRRFCCVPPRVPILGPVYLSHNSTPQAPPKTAGPGVKERSSVCLSESQGLPN